MRRLLLTSVVLVFLALTTLAADIDKYAGRSVLSQGKWVKINIQTPGLQTLSRQTLRNFGFSDPDKVFVYGYGGRMLPEILSPELPDDLPPVALYRKDDGSISFYATDNITIVPSSSEMEYDHYVNPYCESSYYFLSDQAPSAAQQSAALDLSSYTGLPVAETFTMHTVYERDLMQCADSGRDYLGEDFRSTKSQQFKFDLPDNNSGSARIRIRFGANTSGAPSSFLVSANGQRLPSTNSDKIAAVTSSDQYYKTATTVKNVEDVGNSLTVGIEYSQAGVVSMARLDWIEVEYERLLRLRDSQLRFQVAPDSPCAYRISNASENTIIWDVTDPANVKVVDGAFNASDNTVTIGLHTAGLREFFVFSPDAKGATIPGKINVSNQDIHGMPTPDMVIISPDAYTSAAERIANLHRLHDGMTVHVLSPDKIYNEFSGGHPDVSAFRKLLKMWYDRSIALPDSTQFGYCLLMGRPTYDQKRKNPETLNSGYTNTLIWQSPAGLTETTSFCTDDFIGMLEDELTERNLYERSINVAVGRYPVTSATDAAILADKLEAYITSPEYGIWRNNIMVIADDDDSAQHLMQAQSAIQFMQDNGPGAHYAYERLYLDAFQRKNTSTGLEFPEAKERMLKKWQKEGVLFINYIGHANPKEWGHERLLTWEDINSMSNQRLPILYAATCSFGKWDAESVSGAEIMLSNPAGGAISVITPSRTVYIARNEAITNAFSEQLTRRGADGSGQRIGDILRKGKNNCISRDDNMNRYHLFGDPALRMPLSRLTLAIDSIDHRPLAAEQADAPTLKARSSVRISGRVIDSDGNLVDFNGPVQYVLYDAEKSVTTHGWGETGIVKTYQDRNSKLATGSTLAVSGKWDANILMPAEIANNYAPAFLTLYAYDTDLGMEANGSTERIFVYGYDTSADTDTEGPTIHQFVINSDNFSDGDLVHSNPVAMATFSDESGINISDAAVGHAMSLILDNKTVYDDVANYFIPDPETDGMGSVAYPMSEIDPGEHSLTLTVWDNANNSTSATLNFTVGINRRPDISDLKVIYDPIGDTASFKVITDRSLCKLDCSFECLSLNGELLWSSSRDIYAGKEATVSYLWDLHDSNGRRLPRGIYIIRAKIASDDGLFTVKSKKIAIPSK